jgi:hypothetical protein
MKITALLVLKPSSSGGGASSSGGGGGSGGPEAVVLANATDVSHFGFFQRGAAREFIVFVARTVAQRTQPGQRQSVQHEGKQPIVLLRSASALRVCLLSDPMLRSGLHMDLDYVGYRLLPLIR